MTGDSTVAEIEAVGGTARDRGRCHQARGGRHHGSRVVQDRSGSMCSSPMPGRGRPIGWHTKASTLDPAPLQLVVAMNLFGSVYSCNSGSSQKQSRSGRVGRPTFSGTGRSFRYGRRGMPTSRGPLVISRMLDVVPGIWRHPVPAAISDFTV